MIKIRGNVFETNSSSMHSLVVTRKSSTYSQKEILRKFYLTYDNETNEEKCVWNIWEEELRFGRSPFRALGTFYDKWLYACASLVKEYKDDVYNELERIALKYVPGLKKIKVPLITEYVANKDNEKFRNDDYYQGFGKTEDELEEYLAQKGKDWNLKLYYWEREDGYWAFDKPYTGYVDENILGGFLEKENISIEEFLLNRRYIVIQDGDEYYYWEDIKDAGLINTKIIDHEYSN